MFIVKGVLKICSNFTGEHPCRRAISIKLQSNFIEMALRHARSLLNLLHTFRTPFLKNTSGRLLLKMLYYLPWYTGCHQNYPSKDNLNKDIWNITRYMSVNESVFTLYLYKFCVTVFTRTLQTWWKLLFRTTPEWMAASKNRVEVIFCKWCIN